jgi:hypothetical protein
LKDWIGPEKSPSRGSPRNDTGDLPTRKIYNNQVSTPRPCQAAAKHLGCPSARVAMDALTLVGDGVEVVGRVGISELSYPPRQLHGERIVGTELARLHLHMTNIASAQTTTSRADTASPSVTTSRRTARVANASSAHLLGRQDALRVLDDGQPACFKLTPSGTVGVLRDVLPDPLEVGLQLGLADRLLGDIALPPKAVLVASTVDGVAGGGRRVTTRGAAQSRHQRSRHSKVAEGPWETGTET